MAKKAIFESLSKIQQNINTTLMSNSFENMHVDSLTLDDKEAVMDNLDLTRFLLESFELFTITQVTLNVALLENILDQS